MTRMDMLARLSDEHETLLPLITALQADAEAGDNVALVAGLVAGQAALTIELDAHIALEEDDAFARAEEALGSELVLPFRAEHTEIRALRDRILSGAEGGRVSIELCLRFCDLLLEHMQREDAMLFPSLRTALDP
jgi:hemerythrin-like domain-containing protein